MIEALVAALDARDHDTCIHSRRVAEFTLWLARKMDLPAAAVQGIGVGALLHDIGKIGISDAVLLKPCGLTAAERDIIKNHPSIGVRILKSTTLPPSVTDLVYSHQECYDGSGYPRGLIGSDIPIGARIFAVVDTFDCITNDRPYRKAQPFASAREEIVRCCSSQFDPKVVEAYLSIDEAEWQRIRNLTMQALTFEV